MEHELRRLGREDFRFHSDEDLERCLEMLEDIRRQSIYTHPASECSTECRLRGKYGTLGLLHYAFIMRVLVIGMLIFFITGCGNLWVTDGIWKLSYPHCMYQMKVKYTWTLQNCGGQPLQEFWTCTVGMHAVI